MTPTVANEPPKSRWLKENREWLARAQERWAPRSDEPLTLRMWLAAPIAWDAYDGLTLEGALQAMVVTAETGRLSDDVFCGCPRDLSIEDGDIAIPIVDKVQQGLRIACSSWAQASRDAVETLRFRRKRARIDAMPGGSKFVIGGGAFKSLNQPIPTVTTMYLDFHVRADRKRLTDLLSIDALVLGRWRSAGLGNVMGTEILPDPESRSTCHLGVPMRSLPVASAEDARARFVGDYDVRPMNTRAPYWNTRTRALCVVPMPRIAC